MYSNSKQKKTIRDFLEKFSEHYDTLDAIEIPKSVSANDSVPAASEDVRTVKTKHTSQDFPFALHSSWKYVNLPLL